MSVSRIPPQYRLGLLWSFIVALLFVVLLGWGVTQSHPFQAGGRLFLAWLFAVPVGALLLRRLCK